jgi:DNA invertase Pin-like site-specific DNA recombinase
MDAQRDAVRTFLNRQEPIASFEEVESGKHRDRPELDKAIGLCRKTKAKLLIAKLDRLARNASFTLALRDSGVDFVCCDMPAADRFTIGLFALLAEKERDMMSQRTKEGLAAAKRRGTRLGNPKLAKVRHRAIEGNKRRATAFAHRLAPALSEKERAGVVTLKGVAACLKP